MIASLLFAVFTAVGPVPAPADTMPVLTLPEVRVERARPQSTAAARMPTGFVTDVPAGSTGHALETMPDLMSRAAGVRVQQYGGLGAFATVSLRGAAPGQLSVYLDGAPLTSAAQTLVNINDLPVTAIDRIEVYRGPSPLGLGPATPGGAINIVTLPSSAGVRASVVRGAWDTWQGSGSAGARRGDWSALVHAGYQGSAGDFTYHDDNGTPYNTADDETARRVNNRFDAGTLLATVSGRLPAHVTVTAREDLFQKRQGVPGLGAVPAEHTRLEQLRSMSQLGIERPVTGGWPSLSLDASIDRGRSRFEDATGELGAGPSRTDDRLGGEQYTAAATSPRMLRVLTLESTAAWRIERATLHNSADAYADPPPSRRDTKGVSIGARVEPWRDRVLFTAGRRWDRQEDRLHWSSSLGVAGASALTRELDSPQLGALVRLPLHLDAKANWSQGARAPSFDELFGNEGSIRGNPALTPERSESWDAGARWSAAPFGSTRATSLELSHYESQSRDLIVYVKNSASSVKAMNIARARIRGEELSAETALPAGFALQGWMHWQSTIDLGSVPVWHGKRLPLRPERHAFARVEWRTGPLMLGGEVEYLGDDYLDRANRQLAPSRTFTGASLAWRLTPALRVTFEGRNLGDVRATDVAGFPLPGRSMFVSCQLGAERAAEGHP